MSCESGALIKFGRTNPKAVRYPRIYAIVETHGPFLANYIAGLCSANASKGGAFESFRVVDHTVNNKQ